MTETAMKGLPAIGAAGQAVRAARLRAGLSLSQLGARAETSKSQISAIERGRANVTLATLTKIADALGGVLVIEIRT